MASTSRIRVATTTTTSAESVEGGGAAVYDFNSEQAINEAEEADLTEKGDWRQVFIVFPQIHAGRKAVIPSRKYFPNDMAWVDTSEDVLAPEQWIPNIVALRGVVSQFDVDPSTGEEEVEVSIEIFPAHPELLKALQSGAVADKIITACVRAVNLFPRTGVEEGASFVAYLSMGYRRDDNRCQGDQLTKEVWDVKVEGGGKQKGGWTLTARKRDLLDRLTRRHRAVWTPSSRFSQLFSPVEACIVMDMHMVLFQFWQTLFVRNEYANSQLHAQARTSNKSKKPHETYGKAALRRWDGPDLFI
ncbi:MAG: hypothetical protein WC654_04595 [Patescibacteria group bacterium]